jgi:hypothetical protein
MCCNNPTDLGCKNSCEAITLDIGVTGQRKIFIRYDLNGAEVERAYTVDMDSEVLTLPADFFNEDLDTTFGVFDQNGTQLACAKVKIMPCAKSGDAEENTVDTSCLIGFISCTTNTLTFQVAIQFSDNAAIEDGTVIRLGFVSSIDSFTPDIEVPPGVTYLDVNNDNEIIILDAAAMFAGAGCVVRVKTNNSGCSNTIDIKTQVESYDGLAAGYNVGNNPYSPIYIYTP